MLFSELAAGSGVLPVASDNLIQVDLASPHCKPLPANNFIQALDLMDGSVSPDPPPVRW